MIITNDNFGPHTRCYDQHGKQIQTLQSIDTDTMVGTRVDGDHVLAHTVEIHVPANSVRRSTMIDMAKEKGLERFLIFETPTFKQELRDLINKHSMENESNTPDFVLAKYLIGCLDNFNDAVKGQKQWYGREVFVALKKSMSSVEMEAQPVDSQ